MAAESGTTATAHAPLSDTVSVNITVLALDRVAAGRLIAFASVEVEIGGVAIILRGLQIVRRPGGVACETPMYRHAGRWVSAIELPDDLGQAIGDAVLAEFDEAIDAPR